MYLRIKEAMELANISRKKMAELLNIKENTLSGYITGKHEPSSQKMAKIVEVTGVTADFLYGLTNTPTSYWNSTIHKSNKNNQLADLYHYFISLDEYGKEAILAAAKGMADVQRSKNEIIMSDEEIS